MTNQATALSVAHFLLKVADSRESSITNLKLQKLLYYCQGVYLAINQTVLFEDNIEAWVHGPVVPSIYQEFKSFGKNPIQVDEFDCDLDEETEEILIEVFDVYGQFSAWKLRDMTHLEPPWMNHEKVAGVIPVLEMQESFKDRVVSAN